ncbi:E3 ubiquitin-protein ligase RNF217 [Actinidia chinensis var. chinensis]|uniref:E3 ubiquitin-protein ligase RNF217 n=1 Tax=Actinidia chinensis var. chinensis TaxID=1590841 RepID=A0A2R6R6J0_ACTCC|nr:E3 ubiquitin-protein ligase RNF217 [Actinidia chinensis var. chinensis]
MVVGDREVTYEVSYQPSSVWRLRCLFILEQDHKFGFGSVGTQDIWALQIYKHDGRTKGCRVGQRRSKIGKDSNGGTIDRYSGGQGPQIKLELCLEVSCSLKHW